MADPQKCALSSTSIPPRWIAHSIPPEVQVTWTKEGQLLLSPKLEAALRDMVRVMVAEELVRLRDR